MITAISRESFWNIRFSSVTTGIMSMSIQVIATNLYCSNAFLRPVAFGSLDSSVESKYAILNNYGDNGSPCLTPRVIGISLVLPFSSLKWSASPYRSQTSSTKSGETPNLCRALSICIWLTVSNAVARFKVEDTEPVSVLLSVTDHVLK